MNFKELFTSVLCAPYIQLPENGASYYAERVGDTLHIYFEWSNGKTDWLNNFDFPAKPYRDMKDKWRCHRGFLRVWKTIEDHLKSDILDGDIKHIVIAGYSHGAAIALLCHEYCKFNRPDVRIEGYGFGSPRVVWGKVREAVKERFDGFTVIRNGRDLVTHLPPAIFGFRHVGDMLGIGVSVGIIKDHYDSRYLAGLVKSETYKYHN